MDAVVRGMLEQSLQSFYYSGRTGFILILWMVFTHVILTAYRSKLYDVLMGIDLESSPANFHDLAFSKYDLFFCSYGGVVEAQMAKSKRPTHRAILASGRLRFASKTAECIRLVVMEAANERTACIDFDMLGEYVLATNVTMLATPVARFRSRYVLYKDL